MDKKKPLIETFCAGGDRSFQPEALSEFDRNLTLAILILLLFHRSPSAVRRPPS
jgi:hypothetical protein